MTAYPPSGSLLETLLLLIQIRRQKVEFLRTLVTVQATVDPRSDGLQKLLDEFKRACFPFAESGARQQSGKAKKALDQFVRQGPLVIRVPTAPPTGRIRHALDRGLR